MACEAGRGLFEDGNSSDGENVCSPLSAGSSFPAALDSDEETDADYLAPSEQGGGVGTPYSTRSCVSCVWGDLTQIAIWT